MKFNKHIRILKGKGNLTEVVREHYLRDDLNCFVSDCVKCKESHSGYEVTFLDRDVAHYVIPDGEVALHFHDILTQCKSTGIILLQTVLNEVDQNGGKRKSNKMKSLLKNPNWVKFHNEFCKDCFGVRQQNESIMEHHQRLIHQAACWYYYHLENQISIVILTEDAEMLKKYSNDTVGVFVMSLQSYITDFILPSGDAIEQYESIKSSLADATVKGLKNEYCDYLPSEVLDAGVKSGRFEKGFIHVNKHNPMREAFVSCSSSSSAAQNYGSSNVLIEGMTDRNRSIDGDQVVVEIFTRDKWKSRSDAVLDTQTAFSDSSEKQIMKDYNAMCTGRVVGVVQRNWREYVATFPEASEQSSQRQTSEKILVIPWEYKIPKIRISTRQAEALRDHRIVVAIDSWEKDSFYPNGHFVRSLGPLNSLDTKMNAILIEYSLKVNPFGDKIINEMPVDTIENPWLVNNGNDFDTRKDLRESHLIFSIDPPNCEDVDDALSVKHFDNGEIELGVHIADVTYFVNVDSATDIEARSRSTSVYFPHRRYDMLPANLSANLCSLLSNVDRYAVSVLWRLDKHLDVKDVWYGRTVIRSSYKLEYKVAQMINDGKINVDEIEDYVEELKNIKSIDKPQNKINLTANIEAFQSASSCDLTFHVGRTIAALDELLKIWFTELQNAISNLMKIADHFQQKRFNEGAIHLESTEAEIVFNKDKNVKEMQLHEHLKIHDTIAECMILANRWVAKRIKESFPTSALLRNHPPPRQESFASIKPLAEIKGFRFDARNNKSLEKSLSTCFDQGNRDVNTIFRNLCIQAMNRAMYISTGAKDITDFNHYGLALDVYTHFTSPIRRYADIIVHRQLLCAVSPEHVKYELPSNKQLEEICDNMNFKHKAAGDASKDALIVFTTMYFQLRKDFVTDATIYAIKSNGVLVYIPRFGLKGAVFLKNRENKVIMPVENGRVEFTDKATLQKSVNNITIIYPNGKLVLHPFDILRVKINMQSSRAHADQLRYDLVSFDFKRSSTTPVYNRASEKASLIADVEDKDSERREKEDSNSLDPSKNPWMSTYKQTDESLSLYNLLEKFKILALTETKRT